MQRYNLWYIPAMPIDVPMVRPRERALPWRVNLLESIQDEGLRHPILIYGHSPKGKFNLERWGKYQEGRDPSMYIAFGTNRYWCLKKLGWKTMPAILSLNKGQVPEWEHKLVRPQEFRDYAPKGRIFVQRQGFGWTLDTLPEEEFCPTDECA